MPRASGLQVLPVGSAGHVRSSPVWLEATVLALSCVAGFPALLVGIHCPSDKSLFCKNQLVSFWFLQSRVLPEVALWGPSEGLSQL